MTAVGAELRTTLAAAGSRLAAASARTELRADLVAGRGLRRGTWRLEPRGRVWRLGTLLLDIDGGLFATGEVFTVADPGHPNYRSTVALQRRELRVAAARARIPVGDTVVIDAPAIDLDAPHLAADSPLVLISDGVGVRWAAGADPVPLAAYLADRVGLLVDPPEGATP